MVILDMCYYGSNTKIQLRLMRMTFALQGFGLKPAIGQMLAEMLPCGSGGWGCLVYANPSNSC